MDIEPSSPQIIGKKLWSIARVVFYMLKKGITATNSKLMHDLHQMLRRSKVAGKAVNDLLLHIQEDYGATSLACRSSVDIRSSIVNRREYEFSCSNSPAYPLFSRRKSSRGRYYEPRDVRVVDKMFDMLNRFDVGSGSPVVGLPGFGRSPTVRQLRVTDSPYPVKELEENPQVDKDAEDFIKKFYRDLKQQRRVASVESPSPYHYYLGR